MRTRALRERRLTGCEHSESKSPQTIVMSPIWMRKLDLARLCEFESFYVEFAGQLELVRNQQALVLHDHLQISENFLLRWNGQDEAFDVPNIQLGLFNERLTDSGLVDKKRTTR